MEQNNKYTKLYDAVLALDNSLVAKIILSKVIGFYENNQQAFMKNDWLARELQISKRQVRRYLTELETSRLIQRKVVNGKRHIIPGTACPVVRTRTSIADGHKQPPRVDMIDHILTQVNTKI